VLKNTLARRAVAGSAFEVVADQMTGPLIYGFSEDAVAAAKVVADFAKTNDKLVIRGGAYGGKALDVNGVKQLASIPFQGSAAGAVVWLAACPPFPVRPVCWAAGGQKRREGPPKQLPRERRSLS
jgi:large subunit ribosomal protein L10